MSKNDRFLTDDVKAMIKNLVLISGMDGTNLLFKPLLEELNAYCVVSLVHDMNEHDNQDICHQVNILKNDIKHQFHHEPVTIIAESYGGLLAYELLSHQDIHAVINIEKVYFVGGFLSCPSFMAKWADVVVPSLVMFLNVCPNWLREFMIGHWIFYGFFDDKMMMLFKEVLSQLSQPRIKTMFIHRLKNIANACPIHANKKLDLPCVYVAASHDHLVLGRHINEFRRIFDDLTVIHLKGSHFLLQYQAKTMAKLMIDD